MERCTLGSLERDVLRFEREAAALARIDHRSVVRVVDFGRDPSGPLYLAMEHVRGVDLQRLVIELPGEQPIRFTYNERFRNKLLNGLDDMEEMEPWLPPRRSEIRT